MSSQDENGARPYAVSAVGLSKHYRLGELYSLPRTVRRLLGRGNADAGPGLGGVSVLPCSQPRGRNPQAMRQTLPQVVSRLDSTRSPLVSL